MSFPYQGFGKGRAVAAKVSAQRAVDNPLILPQYVSDLETIASHPGAASNNGSH
jgi:hypothetical protein